MRRHLAPYLLITLLLLPVSAWSQDVFTHLWGGFGTSLVTRSPEQRHNALTAARDLQGVIIPPGGLFSFNELVGARDPGKGYAAAPTIDVTGQLQDIPGGGICQLASTIYNAGLLSGMVVVERHAHSRTVGHVPPGRDATISSWRKDLKLRNPFAHPLQLKIDLSSSRLTSSFFAPLPIPFQVEIRTEQAPLEPDTIVGGKGMAPTVQRGAKGYATTTRRIITQQGQRREEIVSEDNYPAPSRIVGKDTRGASR